MRRRGLVAAAVTLTMPSAGLAYEVTRTAEGVALAWPPGPVAYELGGDGLALVEAEPADARRAVREAMLGWEAVPGSSLALRFGAGGDPAPLRVHFDSSWDPLLGDPGTVVASTTTTYDLATGALRAAEVHVNAGGFRLRTDGADGAGDVWTIVMHEAGHAVGLAHPCGDPDTEHPSCAQLPPAEEASVRSAAMYPRTDPTTLRREPGEDDRAGLTALYPGGAAEPVAMFLPAPLELACEARVPAPWTGAAPDRVALLDPDTGAEVAGAAVEGGELVLAPPPGSWDLAAERDGKQAVAFGAVIGRGCGGGDGGGGNGGGGNGAGGNGGGGSSSGDSGPGRPGDDEPGGDGAGCAGAGAFFALPAAARRRRARRSGRAGHGRLLVAVLLAPLLLLPGLARAYVRTTIPNTQTCFYWEGRQLPWWAGQPLGGELPEEDVLAAIRTSFEQWAAVECSDFSFAESGTAERLVGFDRTGLASRNVILLRDRSCADEVPSGDGCRSDGSCSNEYDCWDQDRRLIAVTTTTYSQCTGRVVDFDIELNAVSYRFTQVDSPPCRLTSDTDCVHTDLRNTLTHEIGHAIGLDHTPIEDATMYASAGLGETSKRDLHDDDIQGICAAYPAGEATVTCPPAQPPENCGEGENAAGASADDGGGCGCRTTGGAGGASGAGGIAGALLALGWLAFRRRDG